MSRRAREPAQRWLAAAVLCNLVGVSIGFFDGRSEDGGWLALRAGLTILSAALLIAFAVTWWRGRADRRSGAERTRR